MAHRVAALDTWGCSRCHLRLQALAIVFKDGPATPFRTVGPASITAWFFQYSVMGLGLGLGLGLGVRARARARVGASQYSVMGLG